MKLRDLVVIGEHVFVITEINALSVRLAPLASSGDEMLVARDHVIAVGTYRRVE